MSMSVHVVGLRSADDPHYQRMLAVKAACEAANVDLPLEVARYFGDSDDDEAPLEVEVPSRGWSDQGAKGYEIDVAAIPRGVSIIRFYVSW